MGDIAIVGLNKPYGHYSAPGSDYTAIFSALGGGNGGQSLTPGFIVINAAGEAVGYSTQLRKLWTPQVVADHVKHGGTWIDYCGWPFFYQAAADGQSQKLGKNGWTGFAANAGYGWLEDLNWNSSGIVAAVGLNIYGYVRGFPLTQSLDGVAYPVTSTYTYRGRTAMIALVHPSGGRYFWACYTPAEEVIASVGPEALLYSRGVPVAAYTGFIRQVMRNNYSGLAYKKYFLNTQYEPPATTSPSSPTQITSSPGINGYGSGSSGSSSSGSSGSSPSGSNTGGSGKTSKGSAPAALHCPAGYTAINGTCVRNTSVSTLPSWFVPAALGVGGVAAIGYAGYREGWWGSHVQPPKTDD